MLKTLGEFVLVVHPLWNITVTVAALTVPIFLILFLESYNESWEHSLGGTAPSPTYQAEFFDNGKLKLIIWFGNDFFVGRNGHINDGGTRVKYLTDNRELEIFINLMGIKNKCEY